MLSLILADKFFDSWDKYLTIKIKLQTDEKNRIITLFLNNNSFYRLLFPYTGIIKTVYKGDSAH